MIDRLPPQSLEAEQSVLGAILIDRDVVVEVAEFLRPEDFYRQANGTIYRAILDLFERREPVDIVTVAESLERTEELDGVGGRSYLSTLSNQTPTAVHAVQYGRIVERKAVLRNLIAAAGKIAGIGYEEPAEIQEAIDRAVRWKSGSDVTSLAGKVVRLRFVMKDADLFALRFALGSEPK